MDEFIRVCAIKKNAYNQYQITFSTDQTYRISEDLLVTQQLYVGKEVSFSTFQELLIQIQDDTAYQASLVYLSYAPRSIEDVRLYLRQKALVDDEVSLNRILQKLIDKQWLDDQNYAEIYVKHMVQTKKNGPIWIKQKLLQKKIKEDWIQQALDQHFPVSQQEAYILFWLTKFEEKFKALPLKHKKQKIIYTLQQKGYYYEHIESLLNQQLLTEDPHAQQALLERLFDKQWQKYRRDEFVKKERKLLNYFMGKGYDYEDIKALIELYKEQADED